VVGRGLPPTFPFDPGKDEIFDRMCSLSSSGVDPQFPFDPGGHLEFLNTSSSLFSESRPSQPPVSEMFVGNEVLSQINADIFGDDLDRRRLLRCGVVSRSHSWFQSVLRWLV
jgi:hypothetical protein